MEGSPRGYRALLKLAVLAVAAQAACGGPARPICLDALPLPWLAADCPDLCCSADDDCCAEVTPGGRSIPALPPCCVGSVDFWHQPAQTSSSPEAPLATSGVRRPAAAAPQRCDAIASAAAQRPPPPGLTGTVRLQV